MAITVTMNPRTTNRTKFQPINAQRVTESRQNDNFGLPVSKRPRVGSSPVNNKSAYKFSKQAKSYGTNNAHVTSSGMTSLSVRPAAMTSVGKPLAMTSSTVRPSAMTSSRVTSSVEKPLAMTSSSNVTSSVVNNDFDDDDDFTGAELEEIEMLASQVESQHGVHKQPSKPDKTSTASGSIQFKLPHTSHIRTPSTNNHNKMSMNNNVTLLQQQFNEQEKKIKEMAKLTNQKSGEARVLRDKLKHAEKLLFEERQAKILQENEKKEEKIKHENELAKKLEALTDQIAFKEAELKEAESVIKNLSLKNKMVQNMQKPERKSSGQPCFPSDDWACTQSSESAKKRIRLVKPESPKVSSNMGKLKRSGSTSGHSKPTPQKQTADQKALKIPRSKFKMSSTLLKPAIAPSCGSYNMESLILFLHQCNALSNIETFASSPQTTQQTLTNAIEGTKLLLFPSPTNNDEENVVSMILPFIKSTLTEDSTLKDNDELIVSLEALETLLSSQHTLNIIRKKSLFTFPTLLFQYLNHPSLTKVCLQCLVAITKDPTLLENINIDLSRIRDLMSHDLPIISLVVQLISNLTSDSSLIEAIVTSHIDNNSSILSSLCTLCCNNQPSDVTMGEWVQFLTQVIQLLSRLTCDSDLILIKHNMYATIYHTLNIILYNQLITYEKNGSCNAINNLIKQGIVLLHSCSNVYIDGVPGVPRDHRHHILLWKLQHFVENEKSTFWSEEIKRILKSEITSLES